MKTFKFIIPQEMINYLERLDDEVITHHRVVSSLIYSNLNDHLFLESELFRRYNDEYVDRVASFEIAKSNIASLYIPPCLRGSEAVWHIDFASHEFTVTVYSDKFKDYTEEDYLYDVSREI